MTPGDFTLNLLGAQSALLDEQIARWLKAGIAADAIEVRGLPDDPEWRRSARRELRVMGTVVYRSWVEPADDGSLTIVLRGVEVMR